MSLHSSNVKGFVVLRFHNLAGCATLFMSAAFLFTYFYVPNNPILHRVFDHRILHGWGVQKYPPY